MNVSRSNLADFCQCEGEGICVLFLRMQHQVIILASFGFRSSSCFEVTFMPQSVHPVPPADFRTQTLTSCPRWGSCWPSLLMLSALHDRWDEMHMWWLKFLFVRASHSAIVFQSRDMLFLYVPFEASYNDVPYLAALWWRNEKNVLSCS